MNVSSHRATSALPARPAQATRAAAGPTPNQDLRPAPTAQAAPAERPAPAAGDAAPDRSGLLARFDGFADAIRDRLAQAEGTMQGADAQQLAEARDWLEHGLGRMRSGFAEGTLDPMDMERGVGNLFAGAAKIMAAGGASDGDGADVSAKASVDAEALPDATQATDSPMATHMRERMQQLVDHVLQRADAAGYPDDERRATAEAATAAFASAAERLESAVFDHQTGAPIDRAGLTQFFQAAFGSLQGQLSNLLSGGPTGPGATTYGPGAGAEALREPRGRLDLRG